jgi:hypothetical protein
VTVTDLERVRFVPLVDPSGGPGGSTLSR